MKNLKVKFNDDSRDFSGWAEEKTNNVIKSLCWMLRENSSLKDDFNFRCAIKDLLKLYALYSEILDVVNLDMLSKLILEYNFDGYEFLEDLIHDSKSSKLMKEIYQDERVEEILLLIEENTNENRTKIAELLAVCSLKNAWVERVRDDIEEVHQGRKTWEWFYQKHSDDRSTFKLSFNDSFIKEVYEYFKTEC